LRRSRGRGEAGDEALSRSLATLGLIQFATHTALCRSGHPCASFRHPAPHAHRVLLEAQTLTSRLALHPILVHWHAAAHVAPGPATPIVVAEPQGATAVIVIPSPPIKPASHQAGLPSSSASHRPPISPPPIKFSLPSASHQARLPAAGGSRPCLVTRSRSLPHLSGPAPHLASHRSAKAAAPPRTRTPTERGPLPQPRLTTQRVTGKPPAGRAVLAALRARTGHRAQGILDGGLAETWMAHAQKTWTAHVGGCGHADAPGWEGQGRGPAGEGQARGPT
jgi:hypothetical protein